MKYKFEPIPMMNVKLLPGLFKDRSDLNRKYIMSLKSENLLQNHYMEAGLWNPWRKPEDCHWGWESPTSSVRGQFLGHWLSAAAKIYNATGDIEVKSKADYIISELGRCQRANGGEWVASIPEKYLQRTLHGMGSGIVPGVPHYVIHKTLMGLWDMYEFAGNKQALEILLNFSQWFERWTKKISREEMNNILDIETGGMLEIWANLYGETRRQEHIELLQCYERRSLFNRLLAGEDPLTNMHANTTVPEALGGARAYEVTGDDRWRKIVEAYWRCAVTDRKHFCTGGADSGEIWCPPNRQAARLGQKTHEHCTAYNMIRLAEFLLRWTGDAIYSDYMERSIYNGVLAQQNHLTGMPAYYLPLDPGARKVWGTPTETFWCCHGSVVQAHSLHESYIYYKNDEGFIINQYIPSELMWERDGNRIKVTQEFNTQAGNTQTVVNLDAGKIERPNNIMVDITVACEKPSEFTLKVKIPWWVSETPTISVNGVKQEGCFSPSSFYCMNRAWSTDSIHLELPKSLTLHPLSDKPDMAAFMDGPIVLAGLCDGERVLFGDYNNTDSFLRPIDERHWSSWLPAYITQNQYEYFRFIPLYSVTDEKYTVYFPIKNSNL
jgi:DUF1680 family protein